MSCAYVCVHMFVLRCVLVNKCVSVFVSYKVVSSKSGVALTFEKLCIANAQHGKNCVSSPAAKATISTDLPKIDKHENTNV